MNRNPKISIVTPAYNSEKYIENCINSIMQQSYENYEHIIIDGGSEDHTVEILKKYESKYNMKWISEPDNGMYDAINKGFKMAGGDILSWLNSDDSYFPWSLEAVQRAFSYRNIQWLTGIPANTKKFGDTNITYLMPNLPTVFNRRFLHKGIYDGIRMRFVQQESCFWSRELWEKIGGEMNGSYKMAGDYYLWKKFAAYEPLYTIHCNLASFHIHDMQKSSDMEAYYREMGKQYTRENLWASMISIYLHLYSLTHYKKYVINLEELYANK